MQSLPISGTAVFVWSDWGNHKKLIKRVGICSNIRTRDPQNIVARTATI
jgi:hypothetical protein